MGRARAQSSGEDVVHGQYENCRSVSSGVSAIQHALCQGAEGAHKKCVVLDLDGTLWGGIVGEVGAEGVALGPTAPGIEYVDFQRALLGLTRRGILLAVCSKNNPEDALPVIRTHPHMVLREEQFAAMRINWGNKADSILEIAQELNIGLDSLVFIDDNPNERELIKQMLPEVLTVDLPKDPSLYRRMLEDMT